MEKLLIVVVFFALNKQVTMRGEGNFIKTVQFIGKHVSVHLRTHIFVREYLPLSVNLVS